MDAHFRPFSLISVEHTYKKDRVDLLLKPRSVFWLSLWFGILAGIVETAGLFGKTYLFHAGALGNLQMNRHAFWMISAANALVFGTLGIVLTPLALSKRSRLSFAIIFLVASLAVLCVLFTVATGLALAAYLLLSCGIGLCMARGIAARYARFERVRRRTTPVFLAALLGMIGLSLCAEFFGDKVVAKGSRPAKGSPNVLWIVLDTIRADSLSLYGYERPTSPHLEALSRAGIRFDNARSTASWTLPSHASMFTGKWPHELSARLGVPLDDQEPTIAEYLESKGYATAGFVANTFFCNAWYGLGRGFGHYEDSSINLDTILRSSGLGRRLVKAIGNAPHDRPQAHRPRLNAKSINQSALDWIADCDDRPYFVFMNYFDAHDPYLLPEGEDSPQNFRSLEETDEHREILRNWHQNPQRDSPEAIQLARDAYDEGVSYLDEQVGRFVAELRQRGDLENTLIIVTADHGELIGEHGEFGHGSSLRRQLTHVPLLIIPPSENSSPRAVSHPVSLRDLPATVVDMAGLAKDSPFPGCSLARHWSAKSHELRETDLVLSEVEQIYGAKIQAGKLPRALVAEGRTYIRLNDGREELYDLEDDPQEAKNLIHAHDEQAVIARFRRRLEAFEARESNGRAEEAVEADRAPDEKSPG